MHLRDRVANTQYLDDILKEECLDRLDKKMAARSGPYRRPSWTVADDNRRVSMASASDNSSHSERSEPGEKADRVRGGRAPLGDFLDGNVADPVSGTYSGERSRDNADATAKQLRQDCSLEYRAGGAVGSNAKTDALSTGSGILRSFSAPMVGKVAKNKRFRRDDWVVDDRILTSGHHTQQIWTVRHTTPAYSRQRLPKVTMGDHGLQSAPVPSLLDGSDNAVAAASTVVDAAKALVAPSPPLRGNDSLLRTTLRYALKGAPSF